MTDLAYSALSLEIQRLLESTNVAMKDSQHKLESVERTTLEVQDRLSSTEEVTWKVHDQVQSVQLEARTKAIYRWLSAPDPSTNYQSGCQSRHAATGVWFTKSERFLRWKRDENSTLWLYGKVGCGKTILSTTIITEILHQCDSTSGAALAFFFFDFNDPKKQKSCQMIRSIITQLFRRSPEALAQVESLFTSFSDGHQQPDDESLLKVLQTIIRESDHTYIVLDALDECSDINNLLTVISKANEWRLPTLHLLLTSRWLTIIEGTIRSLSQPVDTIEIQSKLVDKDISDYVSEKLRADQKLQRWHKRSDIQEEIRLTLTAKADGMYESARTSGFIACLLTPLNIQVSLGCLSARCTREMS